MSYRIAIATKDGKVVTDHFGHCERFSIVEVKETEYSFLEFREVTPACDGGAHTVESMSAAVTALKDCSYILVYQIGWGAVLFLEEFSIKPITFSGFVEDGIRKVMEEDKRKKDEVFETKSEIRSKTKSEIESIKK